jgi:diguanylate cyclase (GGDEF)-like protein/PAS domain S-box-containing protein
MNHQLISAGKTEDSDWHPAFARAVIDCLPGIYYLLDEQGKFCHWNSYLEKVTGYSSAELADMTPADLFVPELKETVRKNLDRALETGQASFEAPLLTRFGTTQPFSYYGRSLEIHGRRYIAGLGLDASRLQQAQQAQAEQAQQLSHLAAHVPGAIYQLRLDPESGQFSMPFASNKLFEVFGVHHDEVRADATVLFERLFQEDNNRIMRAVRISARDLTVFRQQFRMCPPGGSTDHAEWIEVESTPERMNDGTIVWHGFARLITERRRMEDELTRLAFTDSLTGMPNRTQLQIMLDDFIADASVIGNGLAILHLDLDNFKDINDVWGHTTGDRLLARLAARLSACIDERGTIGRLGGDEFLILLEGPNVEQKAFELAEHLCSVLESPLDLERRVVTVTGSVGVSLFPEDGETSEDLLRHADAALYRAKASGPGSWARYTPDLTAAAMARRYLETELRSVIESDQLQVALQPIVEVRSGRIRGYEALARWHHPDDGWIDPEQFIALAESRGLITSLGERVYRKAMAEVANQEDMLLSINVAPVQLCDSGFAETLVALARSCGLAPTRVEVEITERVFMEENAQALRQIERLREYGVSLAIDDFGTGYSSLAYLRKLPIQRLKIDQSFVRDVDRVRENGAIVKAIVAMARELGLAVTAEGVQTAAELEFLKGIGCDLAQGWFFGRGQVINGRSRPYQSSQSSSSSQAS